MGLKRFNGAEAWKNLTHTQQAAIGAAALEYAACFLAADETDNDVIQRATAANDAKVAAELFDVVKTTLPAVVFGDLIPTAVGQVCRTCGCTEYDACPSGCTWVEEDLCSACAP